MEEDGVSRTTVALAQNNPNPFNPIAMIVYQLPETTPAKLTIYT